MSDVYNQLGTALNAADLACCKALGKIVGFTHLTELPVPLHVQTLNPNQREFIDVPVGDWNAKDSYLFLVPSQVPAYSGVSGFSGSYSIQPQWSAARCIDDGDVIEFCGKTLYVNGVVQIRNNGYTWVVTASERRTLNLGERS